MTEKMLVHSYNPAWAEWFVTLQALVGEALGDACLSIEHVGSTSVRGLAGKAIIDIDIVFPVGGLDAVVERLAILGYVHNGDQGVPSREVFKLADEQKRANLPVHHLYACPQDSPELARHLFFREWMKSHPADRDEYTRKKFLLAELCDHDRRLYADVKAVALDSFFRRILAQDP
ncbi:MAG: GrpB family protein [Caldilineaceae bacterium]|nr:GrpB family protein [Caldilineaceae bacterium]